MTSDPGSVARPARAYPRECEHRVSTRDGTAYLIRPIVPEDAEREIAFVRSLSTESRYRRLMYSLREPTRAMIEPYVNVDYDHRMALVALHGTPGDERIVGVARYALDDRADAHEFAVVVADGWQGRGVGRRLMEELVEYGRSHGVRRMFGKVLHDNAPMLTLADKLGFVPDACPDDPLLVVVTLEMGSRRQAAPATDRDTARRATAQPVDADRRAHSAVTGSSESKT